MTPSTVDNLLDFLAIGSAAVTFGVWQESVWAGSFMWSALLFWKTWK